MELRQYGAILRRWLWFVLLGTLLIGGMTYVISRNTTPVYLATATIFVDQATNVNESVYGTIIASERQAQTYAQLMLTRPVLDAVTARLGLPELTSVISVEPIQDTQLIRVDVEDTDKELATQIANTIPEVFVEQHTERQLQKFTGSRESLDKEIRSLSTNISQVQTKITELEAIQNRTSAQDADLSRFQDSLQQYRNSYANLVKSFEDLRLNEARATDTISTVEPAEVPKKPVRPRVLLNTVLGLLVGMVLAIGGVLLIEYLDDTLKNPDDVVQALKLSTLGAIPRTRQENGDTDAERQLVAFLNPKSPVSEAYRILRTNIQFSSLDKPIRTLLVTSANPSEGKSTTAANLAAIMAQTGQKVVLIDTDLRRPVIHKVFNVPNNLGLTSALLTPPDASTLPHLIQPTLIKNLSVLTSGPLPPNPSELLGSRRMADLIEVLKSVADIVIFDSPPALAVTDSAVLARQLDGVLLVIDSGETREPLARRAIQELTKVGAHILGVALNRLSPTTTDGYYYYYYHHYYGDTDKGDSEKQSRNTNGTGSSTGDGGTASEGRAPRSGKSTLPLPACRLPSIFPPTGPD